MIRGLSRSILFACFLAACAHSPMVDKKSAIALAYRACDEGWGRLARRMGQPFLLRRSDLQAKLEGDHWHVWVGKEDLPGIQVDVPLRSSRLDPRHSCRSLIEQ